MGNNSDLLTIKEFAEAAGRSQQTIYRQVSTRLADYTHEIDGQRFVERRALAEVFQIQIQPDNNFENNSFNSENNRKNNRENNPEHLLYEILKAELDAKNKQIEQLQVQVLELTQANKALAQSINADRHNELAGTMQQLLAEGQAEVTDPEEAVEAVSEPDEPVAGIPEEPEQPEEDPVPAKKRRRFDFRSWFK